MREETKDNSYLKGAAILTAALVFAKIVSAIYKIPIARMLGAEGTGYFQVTYNIFVLILALSTAGIPVALSRIIASANARGNTNLIKRYYSVAMPAFTLIGLIATVLMIVFADNLAHLMNSSHVSFGIRIIAPTLFFVCIISVFRGYAQGLGNMKPTALSQIIEVVTKTLIGISAVLILIELGHGPYIVSGGAIVGVTFGAVLCIPVLMWQKKKIDRNITYSYGSDTPVLPGKAEAFKQIMKVSIPITLTAASISIMTVVDTSVVLGRLQYALMLTEEEATKQFGLFAQTLMVFNLPVSFIVPVAISIVPAIASSIAKGRRDEAGAIMQSAMKLTNLLAMPAGVGIMVLASPILNILFSASAQSAEDYQSMVNILTILGATSIFVCFHHVNTAILQANGYERIALITFPVGAVLKITISYFLVANPNIGIVATSIGSLACFATISVLNLLVITFKIKERPKFISVFLKPLICALIMAVVVHFTYLSALNLGSDVLGTGSIASALYLALSILVGIGVYVALIVLTRTITKHDLSNVPKGVKIAKLLRVR